MIRSVVFDVGETLVDSTRVFASWAEWLGVPQHTFSAVAGAVVAQGGSYSDVFRYFKPGFDVQAEQARLLTLGLIEEIAPADLYPDARSALSRLRSRGAWIGIAGNQPRQVSTVLRALHLPVDAIATSGEWGVDKPDPAFFDRLATFAPGRRDQIVYVGDHRDYDLLPAHRAGFRTALVRRGPWGYLWADDPSVRKAADWVVDSLDELAERLVDAAWPGPTHVDGLDATARSGSVTRSESRNRAV